MEKNSGWWESPPTGLGNSTRCPMHCTVARKIRTLGLMPARLTIQRMETRDQKASWALWSQ